MRIPCGLLLLAVPFLVGAAAASNVRTGTAAYGGWRSDAPGVVRLIRPQDLPPPFATHSASNAASVVARPTGATPHAPAGFTVQLFASGLDSPRAIRVAPDGTVFVAEPYAGRIQAFRTTDGAVRPAASETFAAGLSAPFGIAFWPPAAPRFVYVAETNRVVRFPWHPGTLRAAGRPETVVPRLPEGGHWTRDIAFSPDGRRLYVSVGSGSNDTTAMDGSPPEGIEAWQAEHGLGAAWGAETRRADVLAFDPDGRNSVTYATGLRNCSGLAIDPTTDAPWCVVNERDGLGDNLPPDYATHVQQGAFYGWPWFYIGDHPDPRHHGARADLAHDVTVPDVLIQPHSAPLGITFYAASTFPAAYRGSAFVALHGSWNRGTRTGYKVIRLIFRDNRPSGEYEDFLTGFVTPRGVWGRPVDVAVAHDGALLVTDDAGGTIWRVAWNGH